MKAVMMFFADFHIHSSYSRATSKDLNLESLTKYAKIKGLNILGTGDFLHPKWQPELKTKLSEENGIYTYNGINFILSCEISLIYVQGKKQRRVHHILLAPNFEVLQQITEWFLRKGRVDYDGRPIFGFSSIELAEAMMQISNDIEIIPAHAWTPWYGIFGSMSGFDSVEECFGDKARHIHAVETGLSSTPEMNWRVSSLDKYALLSFSDCHSAFPWRLGRECCLFDLKEASYKEIIDAIRNKQGGKLRTTIEFFPEEGKYHFDGHRNCNFSCDPKESKKLHDLCPVCRRNLTIGVLNRVEQLADREEGFMPKHVVPSKSLIPLSELIALVNNTTPYATKTWEIYNKLIAAHGNEFKVLLETGKEKLADTVGENVADIIIRNRNGEIKIIPGYDGVYGRPVLSGDGAIKQPVPRKQKSLDQFFS